MSSSGPSLALVTFAALGAGVLLAAAPLGAQAGAPGYHVTRRVTLGGEGGWDYLTADSAAHRLYVTHATHVLVVDTDRDSVVGDIPNTPGVHGVALAPDLGRGYVSDGRDSTVTVFDLKTLAVLARVKVTGPPDAILYEPATRRVLTFNHRSGDATALDAATLVVLGTIPLGEEPEFATSDGRGRVFVNLEGPGQLLAIDARALAVTGRWPLAPCAEPTGMAIDRGRGRLFVGCGNRLMAVVDASSGEVLQTLPIGAGCDGAAYDAGTGLAFASAGDGTITVVEPDARGRYAVTATVATQRGARTMTVDPRTHRLYTVTATFGPAPAATADNPRPRPAMVPGSFTLLVVER